jgi:hypothetical protein
LWDIPLLIEIFRTKSYNKTQKATKKEAKSQTKLDEINIYERKNDTHCSKKEFKK